MNKKISTLPNADAITGAELVPIVQDGVTKQTTISDLRPYKVYSALLTQSGTDAPIAIVLENTIGEIVWDYDTSGSYIGTLTDAFTNNKSFTILTTNSNATDKPIFSIQFIDTDRIAINTYDIDSSSYTDGLLLNTPIEIRVYN